MNRTVLWRSVAVLACAAVSVVAAGPVRANDDVVVDALVSVGGPEGLHPRNAQNEPALAVDPTRPNVLAAGANDRSNPACSRLAATTLGACSVPPPGVACSGSTWVWGSRACPSPSTPAARGCSPPTPD